MARCVPGEILVQGPLSLAEVNLVTKHCCWCTNNKASAWAGGKSLKRLRRFYNSELSAIHQMVRQFYPGEGNTISYVHLYVCLRDFQSKEKKHFHPEEPTTMSWYKDLFRIPLLCIFMIKIKFLIYIPGYNLWFWSCNYPGPWPLLFPRHSSGTCQAQTQSRAAVIRANATRAKSVVGVGLGLLGNTTLPLATAIILLPSRH